MLAVLARNWWVFALQGVAAILFGVLALVWPGLTVVTLILLFGAYVLVDGVFSVIEWVMILGGVASVLFGLLLVTFPGAGALAVVWLIGIYAIALGILFLILAFRLRGMLQEGETGGTSDV